MVFVIHKPYLILAPPRLQRPALPSASPSFAYPIHETNARAGMVQVEALRLRGNAVGEWLNRVRGQPQGRVGVQVDGQGLGRDRFGVWCSGMLHGGRRAWSGGFCSRAVDPRRSLSSCCEARAGVESHFNGSDVAFQQATAVREEEEQGHQGGAERHVFLAIALFSMLSVGGI